jgi:hypothetical protein
VEEGVYCSCRDDAAAHLELVRSGMTCEEWGQSCSRRIRRSRCEAGLVPRRGMQALLYSDESGWPFLLAIIF